MQISSPGARRLVTLVNPNFVKPGVTPYALDILCSHLEVAGFDVEVLDLTFREADWRLAEYFAARDPQQYVPESQHYRVALPTVSGDGQDDNNYADNPFLKHAVALGYKGAFYSWWRDRDRILEEASLAGLTADEGKVPLMPLN